MQTSLCRALLCVLTSLPLFAAAAPVSLRVDQTRYFPSDAEEARARLVLQQNIKHLEADRSSAPAHRFQQAEALYGRCLRHHAYLELRQSRDRNDAVASAGMDEIGDICGDAAALARTVGQGASPDAAWVQPYRYFLERGQSPAPHAAAEWAGTAIDHLADPALSSFRRLFRDVRQAGRFEQIDWKGRQLDAGKDAAVLATVPDRAVRERAWRARWLGLAAQREAMADVFIGVARVNDGQARLRGYDNAPQAAYLKMGLDSAQVQTMLQAVGTQAGHLRAWQQARRMQLQRTGIAPDPAPWDMALPAAGFVPPVLSLAQVQDAAGEAMQVLGPDYVGVLQAILDPAGGRLDIDTETGARVQDAFSISAPGAPSVVYVGRFRNDLDGDVELVHEANHAAHGQWMDRQGASALYRNGTGWLNETFAIFGELMFRDELQRQATDVRAKAWYQQSLVEDMVLQIFTSAQEATLEQALYDGVAARTVSSADGLDALAAQALAPFDDSLQAYPQQRGLWQAKRLMVEDPLYLVNYLPAGLVAVRLYALQQQDPQGFRERYLNVAGRGFDRPPMKMVEELLGEPVDWQQLVDEDMKVFDQAVARWQALQARGAEGVGRAG
ncbi:M3 family metallopeptidase [Stenotrophomonas sp. 24(2023)]|uniref:M3 family metallopeptidase n=1 Tax=Stenotrophomonas sp. 24(2023) TaxID=3068324 RepID=UPI0027DF08D0|nr:M3 family metallopeptidase [Stenotrophomonas sp. 24(2023)]WMJ70892.1 M3 family metallopeptidase [Stenotrophomonas sp. 24(2023)]